MLTEAEDFFQKLTEQESTVNVYSQIGGVWEVASVVKPRKLDSVILDQNVLSNLVGDIQTFRNSRTWYEQTGIPYRRGYLLHGIPGSGKTSTVSALSGYFRVPLYYLNLADPLLNDSILLRLITVIAPHSILLLEDIDNIFHVRKPASENVKISFTGLLNALDGVASAEAITLFITANNTELLDEALIRPGRVDYRMHFGFATEYQAKTLFSRFYGSEGAQYADDFLEVFRTDSKRSMAFLQQTFLSYRHDPEQAIASLKPRSSSFVSDNVQAREQMFSLVSATNERPRMRTWRPAVREELHEGMDIRYVPSHADGDANHRDVERGVIHRITEANVFVRYYSDLGILKETPQGTYLCNIFVPEEANDVH